MEKSAQQFLRKKLAESPIFKFAKDNDIKLKKLVEIPFLTRTMQKCYQPSYYFQYKQNPFELCSDKELRDALRQDETGPHQVDVVQTVMEQQNIVAFQDDFDDRKVSFYKKKKFKTALKLYTDELAHDTELTFF